MRGAGHHVVLRRRRDGHHSRLRHGAIGRRGHYTGSGIGGCGRGGHRGHHSGHAGHLRVHVGHLHRRAGHLHWHRGSSRHLLLHHRRCCSSSRRLLLLLLLLLVWQRVHERRWRLRRRLLRDGRVRRVRPVLRLWRGQEGRGARVRRSALLTLHLLAAAATALRSARGSCERRYALRVPRIPSSWWISRRLLLLLQLLSIRLSQCRRAAMYRYTL